MSELRQLIGTRIRAMRNAKGLTQQKLADIAGLDYRYIGALERGERNFSIDTLEKVLLALNLELYELMYSVEEIHDLKKHQLEAVDEYLGLLDSLTDEQINIMRKIVKEVFQAYQTNQQT
ncbi:helix-turn-helix transcriptional regulator [Paenibacillus sp. E222]|uniref:helix-turn-helix domain-containing protein n=1 Tax=Paenibacillus sp. E222 TaxID=2748863 RepID=UPI0015C662F6|nr:helix-turn-helix transcriptional regulator [Paenibacillus sp. E222]QLG37695.1 helix-turn-helix transcriptional regulator [Paenibacillus sp. E222]